MSFAPLFARYVYVCSNIFSFFLICKALTDLIHLGKWLAPCVCPVLARETRRNLKVRGSAPVYRHRSGVSLSIYAGGFSILKIFHGEIFIPDSMIQLREYKPDIKIKQSPA